MKPNVKKLLILNLPYLFFVWLFMKGGRSIPINAGDRPIREAAAHCRGLFPCFL